MIKNVSQKIGFSFFFISDSRLGKCDFAECNPRESFNRKTRVIFPLASLYPCLTSRRRSYFPKAPNEICQYYIYTIYKKIDQSHLSGDPSGIAIPYPLTSKLRPTFIVSQGFLMFTKSFLGDSMSKANLPFEFLTLWMPSSYVSTNTCVREFMNCHILLYNELCDLYIVIKQI